MAVTATTWTQEADAMTAAARALHGLADALPGDAPLAGQLRANANRWALRARLRGRRDEVFDLGERSEGLI